MDFLLNEFQLPVETNKDSKIDNISAKDFLIMMVDYEYALDNVVKGHGIFVVQY